MGKVIQLIAFTVCLWAIGSGQLFAQAEIFDYGNVMDQGDSSEDYYWPAPLYKRAGFWSPHPSDYNPMRRPTHPVLRPSSKRDTEEVVFHPMARATSIKQHQQQLHPIQVTEEILGEEYAESRPKKHMLPSKLLFKNGGSGSYPNVRRQ